LEMDRTDKKIISLLMENPDISQSEIASHLKMSQPAIYTRIRRLKNRGIINSFGWHKFKEDRASYSENRNNS